MKYAFSLITGLITGIVLFLVALYYNPFASQPDLPLLSSQMGSLTTINYDAVPENMLVFSSDDGNASKPKPESMKILWEPAIADTQVWLVPLRDSYNSVIGMGVKFASLSNETNILKGKMLENSDWHIYRLDGSMLMLDQVENHWRFIKEVVFPAKRSSAGNWRGQFEDTVTVGPNAIGTGRAFVASGSANAQNVEVIEHRSATSYSSKLGPVSMTGTLTLSLEEASATNDR